MAKKQIAKATLPNVTEKPWGHEVLIAKNDLYVVKQLFVKAGRRLSLQIHRKKFEHITLVSGAAHMLLENDTGMSHFQMPPMTPIEIAPGTIHRLSAGEEEDAVLIEVSTPELDDVIRIEDDYGRADDLNALQEEEEEEEEEGNYGIDTVIDTVDEDE